MTRLARALTSEVAIEPAADRLRMGSDAGAAQPLHAGLCVRRCGRRLGASGGIAGTGNAAAYIDPGTAILRIALRVSGRLGQWSTSARSGRIPRGPADRICSITRGQAARDGRVGPRAADTVYRTGRRSGGDVG